MPKGEARQQQAERWIAANGEALRDLIEVQQVTQVIAARQLQTTRAVVQRACIVLSLQTQRTGPRAGPLHPEWKGGRVHRKGYWYCYAPSHPYATKQGYVLEHRLVVEHDLHRYLLPTEVVHHRDANRANNLLENLEVFQSNADHLRHELTGRVPNWTPAGLERIAAGVQKAASIRRK